MALATLSAMGQARADTWNYTFNGFGTGSFDKRQVQSYLEKKSPSPGVAVKQPTWSEYWLWLQTGIKYNLSPGTSVGVNVSAIYAGTLGDGDANIQSTTAGSPNSVSFEEAYGFLKTPIHLGPLDGNAVLQLGRQRLVIDDGFLVGNGTVNAGERGAYFIVPRLAFKGFGTLRINTSPVRGDLFVMQNNTDNPLVYGDATYADDRPRTTFAGGDIELFANKSPTADGGSKWADRSAYLNFTYLRVLQAESAPRFNAFTYTFGRRENLNVFSVGTGGHILESLPVPALKDASFYSQVVVEKNYTQNSKVDALAYYVEPGYQFSKLPLVPYVYYRYSHFGGQQAPLNTTNTKTSYDPMFAITGPRGPFSGYFSKIMGNYIVGNSNINEHQIGVVVDTPLKVMGRDHDFSFGAIGYDFNYASLAQAGTTYSHLANEVDLIARYQIDTLSNVYTSIGAAKPGSAGIQAIMKSVAAYEPNAKVGSTIYLGQIVYTRSF